MWSHNIQDKAVNEIKMSHNKHIIPTNDETFTEICEEIIFTYEIWMVVVTAENNTELETHINDKVTDLRF